jgi:hypothetical protein
VVEVPHEGDAGRQIAAAPDAPCGRKFEDEGGEHAGRSQADRDLVGQPVERQHRKQERHDDTAGDEAAHRHPQELAAAVADHVELEQEHRGGCRRQFDDRARGAGADEMPPLVEQVAADGRHHAGADGDRDRQCAAIAELARPPPQAQRDGDQQQVADQQRNGNLAHGLEPGKGCLTKLRAGAAGVS